MQRAIDIIRASSYTEGGSSGLLDYLEFLGKALSVALTVEKLPSRRVALIGNSGEGRALVRSVEDLI